MHLSEIWVYPVKSLAGIRLREARVHEKGLQHDRRWMITDQNGTFLTQRQLPAMALISTWLQADSLVLSLRDQASDLVIVPFKSEEGQAMQVRVWDDIVTARSVSAAADRWLSSQLGKEVRLVQMDQDTDRKMNPDYGMPGSKVSFADDFPYLLTSAGSLADLNSRLGEKIDMRRFRPNFVVSGALPFEEDVWKQIAINDVRFNVSKPCERCVMVNINPDTALKTSEPLRTLAGYRRENRHVLFGQNLVAMQTGVVREGDAVIAFTH